MIIIPLSKGYVAIVDETDQDLANRKWFYSNGYAVRRDGNKVISMHRIILSRMHDLSGKVSDHVNRNRLDNRRENLRPASRFESQANRGAKKGKSGYRGVYQLPSGMFGTYIQTSGKTKYVGTQPTAILAAQLYDYAAKDLFGEFAVLNFP